MGSCTNRNKTTTVTTTTTSPTKTGHLKVTGTRKETTALPQILVPARPMKDHGEPAPPRPRHLSPAQLLEAHKQDTTSPLALYAEAKCQSPTPISDRTFPPMATEHSGSQKQSVTAAGKQMSMTTGTRIRPEEKAQKTPTLDNKETQEQQGVPTNQPPLPPTPAA